MCDCNVVNRKMSADIGVPWRSSAAAAAAVCSNSNSESRSPSLSSLPPLPDLIPIRKSNSANNNNNSTNNTLIKANLKHAPSQNNGQPVCATNNLNMNHCNQKSSSTSTTASSHQSDLANESQATAETTTSIDIKPNATELSLYQRCHNDGDGNHNGTEPTDNGADDTNVSLISSIKQERRPSDGDDGGDADSHLRSSNSAMANSADAVMANVCVSIDASYFTNPNGNTVQCDNSNVDDGDQASSSLSCGTLIKNEVCQSNSSLMHPNNNTNSNNSNSQSDNTSSVVHENAIHSNNNKSEKDATAAAASAIKAGNSKKNHNFADIPKRTTRSALDTYECKPKLYTPLPPHYYSVQYARAARKPKRKALKGKGRGGISKVGRKPKANAANATALKNMVGPKSKTASSTMTSGAAAAETQPAPKQSRISPLFVFATCENARITNVRCEEYDKRNRIVITKTANGWRSIPRTDGSTDISPAMLPNVMLSRIDGPKANGKSTGKPAKPSPSTKEKTSTITAATTTATTTSSKAKTNPTWRLNPFSSQNRIVIKKDVLNNNNDSEFNSMYEMNRHHQMSDCNSSNAENSSGLDTSASDKVHLANDEATRSTHKKHKKHKKKKKHKHKSKLDKMATSGESSFVSRSAASLKRTASQSANDDDDDDDDEDDDDYHNNESDMAHATLIPKTNVTNASGNANASECKFTIRLSKNGESSCVPATKKFLTATATTQSHQSHRSPKSEFVATEKSASSGTGLKLKIISERRGHERASNNSNSIAEMHSGDSTEMYADGGSNDAYMAKTTAPNLDALSAAAATTTTTNRSTSIIDYEKMVVDTKKEIVSPAESPYNHVAYPPSPPLPPRQSQPLLLLQPATMLSQQQQLHTFKQEQQPLMRAALHPPMTTTTTNATSISSCNNVHSKMLVASPDSVPVELYDSKLAVKQCVVSTSSAISTTSAAAARTVSAPTQQFVQCSDNKNENCFGHIDDVDDDDNHANNEINNLNHKKQLQECIELLDESSCEIENNCEIVNGNKTHDINGICHRESLSNLRHAFSKYPELIAPIDDDDVENVDDFFNDTMSGNDLMGKDMNDSGGDGSGNSDDNGVASKLAKIKDSMCMGVDYNEIDSNLLLSAQPVADILSQLDADALAPSTPSKCLSFNDASNMDGLSDALMQFNQNSFDELIAQGFEKHQQQQRAEKEEEMQRHEQQQQQQQHHKQKQQKQTNQNASGKDVVGTTIVSPDSCEDELPKDLSFKKQTKEIATGLRVASPRTISRGSDAIQSPQPSGLPAVPPSPDIMMAAAALHHQHHLQQQQQHNSGNKKQNPLFLDISSPSSKSTESSNHLSAKSDFFDLTSPLLKDENESGNPTNITPPNNNSSNSPNSILKRTLQRDPIDLGHSRHRKSASPTISCSQDGEPSARRMKIDHHHHATKDSNASQSTSINDPDPLTQLRLLMNNPEWKIPDPILVPKNRLNAVLASPAREIPLLLTTRPDLRLPEAFAFPSILQDPGELFSFEFHSIFNYQYTQKSIFNYFGALN